MHEPCCSRTVTSACTRTIWTTCGRGSTRAARRGFTKPRAARREGAHARRHRDLQETTQGVGVHRHDPPAQTRAAATQRAQATPLLPSFRLVQASLFLFFYYSYSSNTRFNRLPLRHNSPGVFHSTWIMGCERVPPPAHLPGHQCIQ